MLFIGCVYLSNPWTHCKSDAVYAHGKQQQLRQQKLLLLLLLTVLVLSTAGSAADNVKGGRVRDRGRRGGVCLPLCLLFAAIAAELLGPPPSRPTLSFKVLLFECFLSLA